MNNNQAVAKLVNMYIKITQNIGFKKIYGNDNEEEIKLLEELRESIELLGYDVNEVIEKSLKTN